MKKLSFLIITLFFVQMNAQKNEEAERKSMIKSELQQYSKMLNYNVNPNTLNYDLKYQRLELDLDPAVQYVSGTVTSHFVPNTNISSIYFDFSNVLTVSEVCYKLLKIPLLCHLFLMVQSPFRSKAHCQTK